MSVKRVLYVGAIVLGAILVAINGWNSLVKADNTLPVFKVVKSWPKPLPAPVGSDGVAHPWVQGEVTGTCVDEWDNVYTVNAAWQVGATVNGTLQGNESGAINGQDATASSIPSPPILAFNTNGNTIAGWGNPSLFPASQVDGGFAAYLPHGAHGCFVDYQGYVWVAGSGDGIVQKYNPMTAAAQGAAALFVTQIGTKGFCDGTQTTSNPFSSCGEAHDFNTSHTLLNEPADIAVDPLPDPVTGTTGSVYVADGYGNHRIVVYTTSDGGNTYQYNRQWGTTCVIGGVSTNTQSCPGGTFGATGGGHPSCVVIGHDGNVFVCDRPNSRIQVFDRSCGAPSTTSDPQPVCAPKKIINIGLNAGQTPPDGSVGNSAFQNAAPADAAAILASLTARATDIDFWPQGTGHIIVDVDLENDNVWLLDHSSATVSEALGLCGILPCPGHNAGHFAFGTTTAVDSQGNIYVGEGITGRRIQKFVQKTN